jgi:hypothetical protein
LGAGTDQEWAIAMMNSKSYVDKKMGSVIDEVCEEMGAVAKIFVYQRYGLDFDDMAVPVKQLDIDNCANYVQGLLENDAFLYGELLSVSLSLMRVWLKFLNQFPDMPFKAHGADLGTTAFTNQNII